MDTSDFSKSKMLQLVSFVIDKETFAIDVMKVKGVERIIETTAIPGMPDFLEGVINLRESIIPIINLRKKFSMPAKPHDKDTRIMLIELGNNLVVGMIVDAVGEVFPIEANSLGAIPHLVLSKMDTRYIRGVARKDNRLIIVLNLEKIFSDEEAEGIKAIT